MSWAARDDIPVDGGLKGGKKQTCGSAGFGWDEPVASPSHRSRSVSESERGRYGNLSRSPRGSTGARGSGSRSKFGDSWGNSGGGGGGRESGARYSQDGPRDHGHGVSASNTAFVGNLWFKTTRAEVDLIFGDFKTKDIRIMTDRDTGAFRGFCYVEFETPDDLAAALLLDGVLVPAGSGERPLRVHVARERKSSRPRTSAEDRVDRVRTTSEGNGGDDGDEFADAFEREVFDTAEVSASTAASDFPSTGNPALDLKLAKEQTPQRNFEAHRGHRRRSLTEHDEPHSAGEADYGMYAHSTGNPALDAKLAKERAPTQRKSDSSAGGAPSSWEGSKESRAMRPKLRLAKRSVTDDPGGVSDKALSTIFGSAKAPRAVSRHKFAAQPLTTSVPVVGSV
eukprot:m.283971 g.283971  ORF g.283971 m.283971 type:complete len:396 (-) comp27013_c1_seq4:963-2150(-)